MDHAATTPMRREVVAAMRPYQEGRFGNPSSLHRWGREARDAVERARDLVASALGAHPREIVFTGGGTEADNLAVLGAARAMATRGKRHCITSAVEHHAVDHAFHRLEEEGFRVQRVPVDRHGQVDPDEMIRAVGEETGLVSLILANNEVGTVQPVAEVGRALAGESVLLHTDAIQAVGRIPVDPGELRADLVAVSSHKIHGPGGVGALVVRRGVSLAPLVLGGPQEMGRRAGTENVAGIVGFSVALDLAIREQDAMSSRIGRLRDRLQAGVLSRIQGVVVHGDPARGHPGILNLRFDGVPAEALVMALDEVGVAVSSGSACTEETLEPSHVLLAMGVPMEAASSGVRFSLGAGNTDADVDQVIEVVLGAVSTLRRAGSGPG
jgi:cysteine desulfurase